jgi:cell pole-organizing protein PopZ
MAEPVDAQDGDGSMETILASIRRIIREDEVVAAPEAPAAAGTVAPAMDDDDDELLVLEPSMMLQQIPPEEARMTAGPARADKAQTAAELAAALFDDEPVPAPQPVAAPAPVPMPPAAVTPAAVTPVVVPTVPVLQVSMPVQVPEALSPRPTHALLGMPDETLLAPQTRAAAAQAFAALQEAVRQDPPPAGEMRMLRSGGPTLEDIVRDEVRGQLKNWLDTNLPELVERVVRQEIERLVRPG